MSAARQRGFSLIELMASLAILSIVLGVVLDGVTTMQKGNAVQVNKVDLTQQSREFMDQIVNDIHQAGYPSVKMFDPATINSDCTSTADSNVACGLINVSSTSVQFEGDVDGSGVSYVKIELITPQGGCPCTLRRGTLSKASYQLGNSPAYYTEVDNVMNTSVFTAYQTDGSQVTLPAVAGTGVLTNIAAIGITLYVRSPQVDLQTGVYPTVTMVATAKISNYQSLL